MEYRNLILEPLSSTDTLSLNAGILTLAFPSRQILLLCEPYMPALPLLDPSTDSNRTLTPRGGTHPGNPAYSPTHGRRRVWIPNLPEKLKFASSDTIEFQYRLIIRPDDPNAGQFAGRLAGGGRRADIYGNK